MAHSLNLRVSEHNCFTCFNHEPCCILWCRFVLARALEEHKRLLDSGGKGLKHVVALSFSPGVTVEGLLLQAFSNTPGFLQ